MKKPSHRLYNLIFPLWLLVGIAPFGGLRGILFIWGSMIIGNFIIDSGVLWLFLGLLKQKENRTLIWKKSLIRIFLFGFLSDILGSLSGILGIFLLLLIRTYFFPSESLPPRILNVFLFLEDWMGVFAIFMAALCIYKFNKKFSFSKCQEVLSPKHIQLLSLGLAILTAPYFMLINPY